ncbi:hypothetical protein TNCV_3712861 [Trichonephila clavipes]|nr:hypothetical protein TNCV_3712861 [Trichonephila clavipes]
MPHVVIHPNKTREKANVGLQDLIPILHNSPSASFKDAAYNVMPALGMVKIRIDLKIDLFRKESSSLACLPHQAFTGAMVDFSEIEGQVAMGLFKCSPCTFIWNEPGTRYLHSNLGEIDHYASGGLMGGHTH